MKTIETRITIAPNGHVTITDPLPADIPPGEHRAVLVIDEQLTTPPTRKPKPPLCLNVWNWDAWPADTAFRREDLYDDDGR